MSKAAGTITSFGNDIDNALELIGMLVTSRKLDQTEEDEAADISAALTDVATEIDSADLISRNDAIEALTKKLSGSAAGLNAIHEKAAALKKTLDIAQKLLDSFGNLAKAVATTSGKKPAAAKTTAPADQKPSSAAAPVTSIGKTSTSAEKAAAAGITRAGLSKGPGPVGVTTPPDRTRSGIDCALDCTKKAIWIKKAGNEFVGRYYRSSTSKWTPLTLAEARALSSAGLSLVALWESKSDVLEHFSYSTGVDEGTSAYRQAMLAQQPAGTPIYFAVDFDCPSAAIAGAINDYFRGIADGFATISGGQPAYHIGVYGSGDTCSWLLGHNRVQYTWLAQSAKWGGYSTFRDWHIKQGKTVKNPFDFDLNQARTDYGGFSV